MKNIISIFIIWLFLAYSLSVNSMNNEGIVFAQLSQAEKLIAHQEMRQFYGSVQEELQRATRNLALSRQKKAAQFAIYDSAWEQLLMKEFVSSYTSLTLDEYWDDISDAEKIHRLKETLKIPNISAFNWCIKSCERTFGKAKLEVVLTSACEDINMALNAPLQIPCLLPLIVNTAEYFSNSFPKDKYFFHHNMSEESLCKYFGKTIQQYLTNPITSSTLFKLYGKTEKGEKLTYLVTCDEYRDLMSLCGCRRNDIKTLFDQLDF